MAIDQRPMIVIRPLGYEGLGKFVTLRQSKIHLSFTLSPDSGGEGRVRGKFTNLAAICIC